MRPLFAFVIPRAVFVTEITVIVYIAGSIILNELSDEMDVKLTI